MDRGRRQLATLAGVSALWQLIPANLRSIVPSVHAASPEEATSAVIGQGGPRVADDRSPLLPEQDFAACEQAVDRALMWLVRQQNRRGGFHVLRGSVEPAVTCLATTAMLARGHQPGRGELGRSIERAIDYVLSGQHEDGMFSFERPEPSYVTHGASHNVNYNQGIAGLLLCEVYGMTTPERDNQIKKAIQKGLDYCIQAQSRLPSHDGSWGYDPPNDDVHVTDLSVVSWNLMFLRGAKNIGFDVPADVVARTMDYVERSYLPEDGGFRYHVFEPKSTQSMSAVGIVMLSLGGKRTSEMIASAAKHASSAAWPFSDNIEGAMASGAVEYQAYYMALAALHLGEPYWSRMFPPIMNILLQTQRADGSWPDGDDGSMLSSVYSVAMYTLTLAVPLQLLPIYQP